MKKAISFAAVAFAAVLPLTSWAQNATTTPVGVVSSQVSSGSQGNPSVNLLSFPLLSAPQQGFVGLTTGPITSFDSVTKTISVTGANWATNSLANAASPVFLIVKSGSSAGRIFSFVSNNASTAVINDSGVPANLNAGDIFELLQGDTILSAFGTPEDGIVGGSTGQVGVTDIVRLFHNGAWRNYFFNTTSTPPRWEQAGLSFLGSQNNVPIRPDQGVIFFRVGGNFTISTTGSVPVTPLKVVSRENAPSINASFFPTPVTLINLGLHNAPNWRAVGDPSVNASNADYIRVFSSGAWRNYYFNRNGNWYQAGLEFLGSRNTITLQPGSSYIVFRGGSNQSTIFEQSLPYNLQ